MGSQNENNVQFLEKVNQIIQMADWPNISIVEATCLIFISGSNCEDSKQICIIWLTFSRNSTLFSFWLCFMLNSCFRMLVIENRSLEMLCIIKQYSLKFVFL